MHDEIKTKIIEAAYTLISRTSVKYTNDRNKHIYKFTRLNDINSYKKYFKQYEQKRNFLSMLQYTGRFFTEFSSLLKCISMSPDKSEDHKEFYFLPSARVDQRTTPESTPIQIIVNDASIPINESQRRLELFFRYLTDKASQLAEPDAGEHIFQQDKLVIYGNPGIGKTTLINYLFSINQLSLNDSRVIHIRINLNDITFANESIDLENRLLAKSLAIITKSYLFKDKDAAFPEIYFEDQEQIERIKNDFNAYITNKTYDKRLLISRSNITRNCTSANLSRMCDAFFSVLNHINEKEYKENKLTIAELVKHLMKEDSADEFGLKEILPNKFKISQFVILFSKLFMSYLQHNHKIGYIFIFDGMDSVTFETVQYELYKDWLDDVGTVTSNKDNAFYKALYIITMRDYSMIRFYRDARHLDGQIIPSGYTFLKINSIPPVYLIRRKIEYIKKIMLKTDRISLTSTYTIDNIVNNIIYFILLTFFDNIKQDLQYVLEKDISIVNNALEALFSNNHRLMFSCINDTLLLFSYRNAEEFAKDVRTLNAVNFYDKYKKDCWYLRRLFITGTAHTELFSNQYGYAQSGDPVRHKTLPIFLNIFNFNEYSQHTELASQNNHEMLPKSLVKYRILKYLNDNPENKDHLSNIFNWLKSNIDNRWDTSLAYESRELIFHDLLRCDEAENGDLLDSDHMYKVRLTSKFSLLESMINKFIYYETIIDDTPILQGYHVDLRPLHWADDRFNVTTYLVSKIKYVLLFIAYLSSLEKHEWANLKGDVLNNYDKYALFSDERIRNISDDIASAIVAHYANISDGEKTELMNTLDKELFQAAL